MYHGIEMNTNYGAMNMVRFKIHTRELDYRKSSNYSAALM